MRKLLVGLAIFIPSLAFGVVPTSRSRSDSVRHFFQPEHWGPVLERRDTSVTLTNKMVVSQSVTLPFCNIKVNEDALGRPQQEPYLAVRGSNIYAVFKDWRGALPFCPSPKLVYFARSTDSGNTWEANYQLIDSVYSRHNSDPVVKVHPNGDVFACVLGVRGCAEGGGFAQDTAAIFVARSTDEGVSFGPPSAVITIPPPYSNGADKEWMEIGPSGNIYVAWTSFVNIFTADISFSRSTDLGNSWSSPQRVNDNPLSDSTGRFGVQIVEGPNGIVHVVWGVDEREGPSAIYMATSMDSGRTFGANRRVAYENVTGPFIPSFPWRMNEFPSVAFDSSNGNLYVAWSNTQLTPGNLRIAFVRSTDGGVNWDSAIFISPNAPDNTHQFFPAVAVDPLGRVFVMWCDTRVSGGLAMDIFYSFSGDFGMTWAPARRVTTVGSVPVLDAFTLPARTIGDYNALAVDGQALYCIWGGDSREGNQDVYFARIPTDSSACSKAKGDMDANGLYTVTDVVDLLNCAFLGQGCCHVCYADVNCDGLQTAADVVLELRKVFLGAPFPCQ